MTQDIHDDESGGIHLGFHPAVDTLVKPDCIAAETTIQDGGNLRFLFPLDTRAYGLDGKLVQQALSKTLTAGDLAKHLESSNISSLSEDAISPRTRQLSFDNWVEPATPLKVRTLHG